MWVLVLILFLALLVSIVAIIFALGNPGVITVHFLPWSFDSSLTLLLLVAFGVGGLLGWLVTVPTSIKRGLTIAGQKKKIADLEKAQAKAEEAKATAEEAQAKAEAAAAAAAKLAEQAAAAKPPAVEKLPEPPPSAPSNPPPAPPTP